MPVEVQFFGEDGDVVIAWGHVELGAFHRAACDLLRRECGPILDDELPVVGDCVHMYMVPGDRPGYYEDEWWWYQLAPTPGAKPATFLRLDVDVAAPLPFVNARELDASPVEPRVVCSHVEVTASTPAGREFRILCDGKPIGTFEAPDGEDLGVRHLAWRDGVETRHRLARAERDRHDVTRILHRAHDLFAGIAAVTDVDRASSRSERLSVHAAASEGAAFTAQALEALGVLSEGGRKGA